MTLELYHSRNLLIAKGRLLKRRRLRTPPRTSIEVLPELFLACNHADLKTVQLRIAELGTLFNPNAFTINCPDFPNSRDLHGAYNRTTTLLLAAIHAESRPTVSAERLAVVRLLLVQSQPHGPRDVRWMRIALCNRRATPIGRCAGRHLPAWAHIRLRGRAPCR